MVYISSPQEQSRSSCHTFPFYSPILSFMGILRATLLVFRINQMMFTLPMLPDHRSSLKPGCSLDFVSLYVGSNFFHLCVVLRMYSFGCRPIPVSFGFLYNLCRLRQDHVHDKMTLVTCLKMKNRIFGK